MVQHKLRIHASDILENDVDKTFSFIVDNVPPKITLGLPKHNTTVSDSLKIDFKVSDKNLSETGAIQILLPQGDSYEDITSLSYNTTNVFAGTYDLKIVAKDLAGNEAVETVPFIYRSFIYPETYRVYQTRDSGIKYVNNRDRHCHNHNYYSFYCN